jgi:hypothetical protein
MYWHITPCSPLKFNWIFGGTCRFHLQGRRISYLFHASFLLGLLFDCKDGGDMFLRNSGWLSTDYSALYTYPRRQNWCISGICIIYE